MNSKTAGLLNKVASIFNKNTKSLKQHFNKLTDKEKQVARLGFEQMIQRYNRELKVKEALKKIEEKQVVDKLESKLVKGKDDKN